MDDGGICSAWARKAFGDNYKERVALEPGLKYIE